MMTNNPVRACPRCGSLRQVNGGSRRSLYCRDCLHNARLELRARHETGQPDWIESASCRSTDPELFYDADLIKTRAYRRVCGTCPVAADCLMYAYAVNDTHGVWGGLTYGQRRHLYDRGAGPTASSDDVTRCRACGAWKLANRFCGPCHRSTIKRRIDE